ncbi:MAG: Na+/H+ antiporter NhaA [Flavobacteriaceae bacterium]|jgi:NhaA family Na+:H+ antiporter|nr:Na+/H+ antiporter NhaA [Flavobacteriaceae bacterium]
MANITKLYQDFLNNEKTSGIILIFCTIISLILANSSFQIQYLDFWQDAVKLEFGNFNFFSHHGEPLPLVTFINDALMTIFFLMVGLELEREIYKGELSNRKKALLPLGGALGGMVVPAAIYMLFNYGTETQSGAGIPMATDIAFALGILSLLGSRVPIALRIFLTALAVIDDLGAILVIAVFYTQDLALGNLLIALSIWLVLLIMNRMKVKILIPYLIGGAAMWYFMLNSGVHATISGVLLAFAIPFGDGSQDTISYKLQHALHRPVNFLILPIFALANTAIVINSNFSEVFTQHYSLGIFFGLLLGKPVGIVLFSFVACFFKLCKLPARVDWKQMAGVGCLGGIGFTMSIFIALLAFDPARHQDYINNAKFMILISSLCSAIVGYIALSLIYSGKKKPHIVS